MTVIMNGSVIKSKLKGDVAAEDPSDLCFAGACVKTKQEVYEWEDSTVTMSYKSQTHLRAKNQAKPQQLHSGSVVTALLLCISVQVLVTAL